MASGVNFGLRATIPHLLGVVIGHALMTIALGMGISSLLNSIPQAHLALKIIGVTYVLFLAWKIFNVNSGEQTENTTKGTPFSFSQAIAFQWINPKGVVVIISAISAYTDTSTVILSEVLILVALFFWVTLGSVMLWAFSGALIASKLDTERKLMIFNRSAALLLLISVAPVLLDLL